LLSIGRLARDGQQFWRIAAGAACLKLIKLDRQRFTYAMGIAATQAALSSLQRYCSGGGTS
jgi:2-methylcitrate dehydratase PrpD